MRRGQNNAGKDKRKVLRRDGGFSLIELLIVVAIILIIAAIAIPNLIRSRMAANEAATVQNMRAITTAEVSYFTTYGVGFSATLANLGPPIGGGPATVATAGLIDDTLATGNKAGYIDTYVSAPPVAGVASSYTLNADPQLPGTSGQRHFYSDQTGVIHQNTTVPAGVNDPPIG